MAGNPKESYATKTSDEKQWLLTASQLISCAKLIGEKSDSEWTRAIEEIPSRTRKKEVLSPGNYQRVHMMLAAFALENLFKYQLVRNNRQSIYYEAAQYFKLPKVLRSHDLVELAKQSAFQFNDNDAKLLKRLFVSSKWIGRYPTPTNSTDYKQYESELYCSSDDTSEITNLIKKVIRYIDPDSSLGLQI